MKTLQRRPRAAALGACLLAAVLMLSGCDWVQEILRSVSDLASSSDTAASAPASETVSSATEATLPLVTLPTDYADDYERRAAAHADEAIARAIGVIRLTPVDNLSAARTPYEAPASSYAALPAKVTKLYDTLYDNISKIKPFTVDAAPYVSTVKEYDPEDGTWWSRESFQDILATEQALFADHPELELYCITVQTAGKTLRPFYYLPGESGETASEDYQTIADRVRLYQAVCGRIVRCMPDDLSVYDRYRYLGIVVDELCTYDASHKTNRYPYQAYNCLINGSAVCGGYARAFEDLCRLADLWCVYVEGTQGSTDRSDAHAWNAIRIGGRTYYADLTFADHADPAGGGWTQYLGISRDQADARQYYPSAGFVQPADLCADELPLP